MSREIASLFLYNLDDPSGAGDFEFRRFPRQIDTRDQANFEKHDVASFVKPLSYANTEPQVIEIPEAWLDDSDVGASVLPDIERLRALMRRAEGRTAPPTLLLICGEWEATVVLTEMRAERTRFTAENRQTRARLSLTFMEVRETVAAAAPPGSRPEDARFSF